MEGIINRRGICSKSTFYPYIFAFVRKFCLFVTNCIKWFFKYYSSYTGEKKKHICRRTEKKIQCNDSFIKQQKYPQRTLPQDQISSILFYQWNQHKTEHWHKISVIVSCRYKKTQHISPKSMIAMLYLSCDGSHLKFPMTSKWQL